MHEDERSRPRTVIRNFEAWGNRNGGIRIIGDVEVELEDIRIHDNGGPALQVEEAQAGDDIDGPPGSDTPVAD